MIVLKFLYFTDTHIRGTNPKSRKDNFLEALKYKFSEIISISKDKKVDYILHGGDFFDRPDVSISVINEMADLLGGFNVPIYVISGNHDIYGHNPKTLHRTMLGLLDSLKILEIINYKKILLEKDGITVQLTGMPYIYGLDRPEHRDYYVLDERDPKADYAIHMVHGFLMNKKFLDYVNHTLVSEISHTLADLTLCGHYHYGFEKEIVDGKIFINPGSVVRISNSLIEMERKPKILLITADKDGLDVEEIYLKSARPGKEVLDRTEIEQHRFKQEEMIAFKEIVERATNMEKIDILDLITEIANSEEISKKVRDEALKRLTHIQMKDAEIL